MSGALPFELRRPRVADYDAIAEIWHSSASLPGVGPPVMPAPQQLKERVPREIEAGWEVTLAVGEKAILGFLAIKRHEAILAELFVRPDALGGGIGKALLAEAMVAMPDGFTLFTRSANVRARSFYERAGLIVLREEIHPRYGDAIVYYGWNGRA